MSYNNQNEHWGNSVYQESVPAGKRKYFLDIRTTREGDYFLTITERKKTRHGEEFGTQRHTIHLYKEDFVKFEKAFGKCGQKIRTLVPDFDQVQFEIKEDFYTNEDDV